MNLPIKAQAQQALAPTLSQLTPLLLDRPAPAQDLPGIVRAGSAVRHWGHHLVVVQDDVHALALIDDSHGAIHTVALPPGTDGRRVFGEHTGNKSLKMDLEACVALPDGRLLVLGSGSTLAREKIVVVTPDESVRLVDGAEWYRALRSCGDFSGSELNLEGAVLVDGVLRLFQRGNGAPRGDLLPVDATADFDVEAFVAWLDGGPMPQLQRVQQYDLGSVGGVRLGFTDASVLPDGRVTFVASAEDSPDTFQDGAVVGSRFGLIDQRGVYVADILDEAGGVSNLKLEGIDCCGEVDGSWEFVVVADMDAPDKPALLGRLRVSFR